MSIVAAADLFGVSGRRQELVAVLASIERDAAQPGCMRYSFATTIAEPDHFVLISEWRDQAALDEHYASPEFASFQFSLSGLLARPSQMTVYSVTGSVRPLASGPMDPRDADCLTSRCPSRRCGRRRGGPGRRGAGRRRCGLRRRSSGARDLRRWCASIEREFASAPEAISRRLRWLPIGVAGVVSAGSSRIPASSD